MPLSAPNIPPALTPEQAQAQESIYRKAAAAEAKAARAMNPAAYVEVPAGVVHLPRVPKVPFFTPAALVVGMARLK